MTTAAQFARARSDDPLAHYLLVMAELSANGETLNGEWPNNKLRRLALTTGIPYESLVSARNRARFGAGWRREQNEEAVQA